jgi:hypothetical protein
LAVGGTLDRAIGGSLLKVKNRGYLFDHTSKDQTEYVSQRRSLYLPVIRNHLYDVYQLLDFPDPSTPSGDRATTTVAPQALMFHNSDLIMHAAAALAERALAESSDDQGRQQFIYETALGRPATADELAANTSFLSQIERNLDKTVDDPAERQRQAWSILCHVIVTSSEFIYVE